MVFIPYLPALFRNKGSALNKMFQQMLQILLYFTYIKTPALFCVDIVNTSYEKK